jgi:diguanylate cyclase (GGDEF)-like protein
MGIPGTDGFLSVGHESTRAASGVREIVPAAQRGPMRPPPMNGTLPARRAARLQLLVVADSDDDACQIAAALGTRGLPADYTRVDCEIDMAAELARSDWDVVLCDHAMRGFDAPGAVVVLKRSGKDVPFIIQADDGADRPALAAMDDGVADFVARGDHERLLPVIERELRAAEARRAVRRAHCRIRELVHFDGLSSLPNHELFCRKVSDWLEACARRGRAVRGALLVVDMDRFMRINVSFGYEVGSEVLRSIAQRLASAVSADVMLARLGGDTFGVFLPGAGEEAVAEVLARSILSAFELPFMKDRIELFLTASIGVALTPRDGATVYELLMNAETAVVAVKRGGGNGVCCYKRTMNAASAERIALEADLRHAIERDELFLHYQPIIDVRRGGAIGAEALLRWRHTRHGVIAPDHFIPLADETGLITEIGAWVLAQACVQGQRWHRQGWSDFRVSVNVSAVQFGQPRLLEAVSDALRASGFAARCLTLEITETSIMSDVESAAGMLRALRNMDVRIAVDDFGTGYSSLAYLKRLPIDVLKIDKSFVRDVCDDEENAAIARAIIVLARSLRLATVAEGVETAAQEALLRGEACDYFQGFRFGRPVAADALCRNQAHRGRMHLSA